MRPIFGFRINYTTHSALHLRYGASVQQTTSDSVLNLPSELQELILAYVQVDDLRSLNLSCRRFHDILHNIMSTYKKLLIMWKECRFRDDEYYFDGNVASIFETVLSQGFTDILLHRLTPKFVSMIEFDGLFFVREQVDNVVASLKPVEKRIAIVRLSRLYTILTEKDPFILLGRRVPRPYCEMYGMRHHGLAEGLVHLEKKMAGLKSHPTVARHIIKLLQDCWK